MGKTMDRLFKGIDILTGIFTGLMVLFVFLNVVLRTFFNSGLTWSEELARYLFVYVTYIGAISAMRSNAHMGVDTLISRVSPKIQLLFYIISQIIISLLMCILVNGAFKMVLQNTQSRTAALNIPYSVLYFGGIITGLSIAVLALGNIIYALKHKDQIGRIVSIQNEEEDVISEAIMNTETLVVKNSTKDKTGR